MTAIETSTRSPLVLEFIGGPYDGRRLAVAGDVLRFGSAADCTLRIHGDGVPDVLFQIQRAEEGFVLDAHAPGVSVNDEPVDHAVITANDTVAAGPVRFRLSAPASPPETASAPEDQSHSAELEPGRG